ncbi:MAG: tetratricopeptide repeat protein [Phycisphaeraceae bacterium]|nr:tetratricopeptide repeat protein [Phycisphaeraceae bacterium]MCW5754246.1 tetratricopeptide repeat protein [Phycisphaeraceae bacterium]
MSEWHEAEKFVDRAHEFYELGRWDEAEAELRKALARNPYQAEWHFNLGLTLEAAGRNRDAVEAFSSAFELSDEDPQAALLAGVNALRADEPKLGLSWLDRAEKLDPASTAPFVHRIDAYRRLADHEQAETMFYLGQQVDAEDPELYAAMAESLLDRREFERAIWCLREAARLDPAMPRVRARLADSYRATGRLERARQLYLRELRDNPGDIETLLDLGCLLADMNRLMEASEKFRRVLEIEPDNRDAQFYLGDLAERAGHTQQALRQYEVVLRLDPNYPEARRRVAGLILNRAQGDDLALVHRLLRMELRDADQRPHAYDEQDIDQLARLLLDSGLAEEAERLYTQLATRRPTEARYSHLRSVALLEAGKIDEGISAARCALAIAPRLIPAMHNLALAYLSRGQWLRARYWVRQGLAVDREDAPLRRLRTRLRLRAVADLTRWTLRLGRRPRTHKPRPA